MARNISCESPHHKPAPQGPVPMERTTARSAGRISGLYIASETAPAHALTWRSNAKGQPGSTARCRGLRLARARRVSAPRSLPGPGTPAQPPDISKSWFSLMKATKGDAVLTDTLWPPRATLIRSLVMGTPASAAKVSELKKADVPSRFASTRRAPRIQAGWRSCGVFRFCGSFPDAWERKKLKMNTSGMASMRRSSWPPPMLQP
mmetsp:Transcript_89380/g.257801  ORF Transcript_89380/g.257801 Transcript_89380/m.257801 type:complete len:205 (+) Transcript_89380:91-705(+)